jgi:hypothetical protein
MSVSFRTLAFLASLCVACPLAVAAPRLVTNCMAITQPGSYIVFNNIQATGDCLVVQSDFVTIDLSGFAISGNGTGAGVVEHLAVGRRGITIRNGTITGFASAIQLGNSTAVTVERIHATANTFAGVIAGDTSDVSNCKIIGNGSGNAINLGQRALVSGNIVNDNQGTGIFVGLGSNVIGNAVGRNQTGISTAEGALVVNNVSRNNRSYGISMDCPGAAIANTTSNNLGDNFHQVGGNCDPTLGDCCVVNEHNSTL